MDTQHPPVAAHLHRNVSITLRRTNACYTLLYTVIQCPPGLNGHAFKHCSFKHFDFVLADIGLIKYSGDLLNE